MKNEEERMRNVAVSSASSAPTAPLSAKALPDEGNREAIEEMLLHAVEFCEQEKGKKKDWREQVPVIEVM